MIGFVAFLLVASGATGLAAAFYFGSFAYAIKLELSWLLYLLWIGAGIGLWMRREGARILALALFLVGALAVPILIGYVALNWKEVGSAVGVLLAIALLVATKVQSVLPGPALGIPAAFALLTLLMIGGSLFSWWLYRYFQRPEVAEQFARERPDAPTPRALVYALAAAYVAAIPFSSAGPTITQDSLPGFAQSRAYKETVKAIRASGEQARARELANFVREVHFSSDGRSVVATSDAVSPEVFFLDAASGASLRKEPKLYSILAADPLAALLSADHRYFLAAEARQVVETKGDSARGVSLPQGIVPIGFSAEAAAYVWFAPASGKLEALDLAADRVLFSVDATNPLWTGDDLQKQELRRALRAGRLSPDRRHFAYVFRNRLHLLRLPEGTLEIDERAAEPAGGEVFFAKEGDALIVAYSGETGTPPIPGGLYTLADKSMKPHAIRPPVHYFSTAERRILSNGVDHVAEHSLEDLANPRRRLQLPGRVAPHLVTADGRALVVKVHEQMFVGFADLTANPALETLAFAPVPTQIVKGQVWPRLAAGPGRLAIMSGTFIELVGTDTFGREGAASQVHNLYKVSQDRRVR